MTDEPIPADMKVALLKIAERDWRWAGGGSDIRIAGTCGHIARQTLGLPLEPRPGWPEGDGL
jgi:hypothetical protein